VIRAPIYVNAPEAEAYRTLRTTLSLSRLEEGRRVVLFTSARRGEGKSTTSANFAVACAYGEAPTLLIDADIRGAAQHDVFHVRNDIGLTTFLKSGDIALLSEIVMPTQIPYLDVIPAGPNAPNAAELLARPSLAELVAHLRDTYEWIILDTAPVLPVTDAAIVSRTVDGVVLLVDARRTPLRVAKKAADLLRSVGAPLLGVALNNARTGASAYGRYPA